MMETPPMDIMYMGTIKSKTVDYPTFSDKQLSEMNILVRGFKAIVCNELQITNCKGYPIPYVNSMEYRVLEGVCTVIRYGNVLIVIEEDNC